MTKFPLQKDQVVVEGCKQYGEARMHQMILVLQRELG